MFVYIIIFSSDTLGPSKSLEHCTSLCWLHRMMFYLLASVLSVLYFCACTHPYSSSSPEDGSIPSVNMMFWRLWTKTSFMWFASTCFCATAPLEPSLALYSSPRALNSSTTALYTSTNTLYSSSTDPLVEPSTTPNILIYPFSAPLEPWYSPLHLH